MKNILILVLAMTMSSFAFGQIKVVSPNGDTKIGDTSIAPDEKLDVSGNIKNRGARFYIGEDAGSLGTYIECGKDRASNGFSGIRFYNTPGTLAGFEFTISTAGNGNFYQRGATSTNFIADDPGAAITFRTTGATRMRLNDAGNLGIGYINATHKLQVNGTAAKPGGGSWVAPSDKRLKKDINTFNGGLKEILEFKPVTFRYNGKAELSDETEYVGVIAQEVAKIAPYMVDEMKYQNYTTIRKDGEDILKASGAEEEYLTVDPNAFTYMLINAVQEQQIQLEEKDSRIDELESKLNKLIEKVENIQGNTSNDLPSFESDVKFESNGNTGSLEQNIPNPFNGYTTISYFIPEDALSARIEIYDIAQNLIKTVVVSDKGNGRLNVDMNNLPSSTFTYSLIVDNKMVQTKQMVLQK